VVIAAQLRVVELDGQAGARCQPRLSGAVHRRDRTQQPARDGAVGAMPCPVCANDLCSSSAHDPALSGQARANSPIRQAPAVCEEDGPTMISR
jgi:hypothetical protein